MTLMNGAGAGFVTKIPHLVHLRGHALQQCSMAVFNPQFQRTRYQGRHGSNARAWSMNIQDALDLSLNEEAFRIIGKRDIRCGIAGTISEYTTQNRRGPFDMA